MQTKSDHFYESLLKAGSSKHLALIGQGISYSLSPLIHNYSAETLGEDCVCTSVDIESSQVKDFLEKFWDIGGVGASVTTPHKELVAAEISSELKSVNSLYRGAKYWSGQSTDGQGLDNALTRLNFPLSSFKHIVILGNGGVVPAILSYLNESKSYESISVLRRNPIRDNSLKDVLEAEEQEIEFLAFEAGHLTRILNGKTTDTLVIQATNAPQLGDGLDIFCSALSGYRGVFVDLIYSKPSAMLARAKELKLPCQDGLPMLIEQALLSQLKWWGQSADYLDIYDMLKSRVV